MAIEHSKAWYDRRATCIGGSDAPAIIGASRWGSKLSVYLDKIGEAPHRVQTSRQEWGLRLEDAVAQWYSDREGVRLRKVGFRRHPVHSFIGGNVDRERPDKRGVEIKTAHRLDESWGEEGSDKVPADYWTQVQHYQILRGYTVSDLVVLVGGNDPKVFTIPADPMFQAMLVEEERRFWHEHVIPRVPPEPDGSEASREALNVLYPRTDREEMAATPELVLRMHMLSEDKAKAKAMEVEATRLENEIKAAMGVRERLVGGGYRASWSERAGSVAWKVVAASLRRQVEGIGEAIRTGDFDRAESLSSVDLDTLEGLYRSDPSRVFSVAEVKRKDGE